MIASVFAALAIGVFAGAAPGVLLVLVMIYSITIPADPGALTLGMDERRSREPRRHDGDAFDRRFRTVGAGRLGLRRSMLGGPGDPRGWFAVFAVFAAGSLFDRWRCGGRGAIARIGTIHGRAGRRW